jgi:hypothetical protein
LVAPAGTGSVLEGGPGSNWRLSLGLEGGAGSDESALAGTLKTVPAPKVLGSGVGHTHQLLFWFLVEGRIVALTRS